MGLTERHWFENEEPELTDRQLEDIVYENKKSKQKHYDLRSELAKWVEKNIGIEYVNEVLEKYDMINSGIPIGDMFETMAFVNMVETVKHEAEGR